MAQDRKLSTYRSKRNVTKTAEPSGETASIADSGKRRFVVQKHDATRLHYDLRLELASHTSPKYQVDWSSISIPRRTCRSLLLCKQPAKCATGSPISAS